MGILDQIKNSRNAQAERRNKKLKILNRMSIQQLGHLYDEYVDLGDTKSNLVEKGSIADFALGMLDRMDSRQKLIAKIADNLSLELIEQKAQEFKLELGS